MQSLIQTGRKHGMFTMDQAVEELVLAKRIDPDWLDNNYLDLPTTGKKTG